MLITLCFLVLPACDEARGTPTHIPEGPMAQAAGSLASMSGCEQLGKVTAKDGPNADFDMRQKAAREGATHVYRMPVSDQTGFGSALESRERVYGQMFKCGARDSGADAAN
jgi:hypothetical protein